MVGPERARPSTQQIRLTTEVHWYLLALVLLDAVTLALASYLAYQLRIALEPWRPQPPMEAGLYLQLTLVSLPIWLLLFWVHGLYDRHVLLSGVREYALVANASTYATVALIILAFLIRQDNVMSRGWLMADWILAACLVATMRFCARAAAHRLRRRGLFMRRVIVAGADEDGVALAARLSPPSQTGMQVVGFVHDYLPPGATVSDGLRVLGEPMELPELAAVHDVDLVIVVARALSWESLQHVMQCVTEGRAPFECKILPELHDALAWGVRVDARGPVPLIVLDPVGTSGLNRLAKGSLDYLGSSFLLLVTLPLSLLLALLSWMRAARAGASARSILEEREFVGAKGVPFKALAFRGWWTDRVSERGSGLEMFLHGRRLHRLPGLLNVLRGEMSLVGPRPITADQLSAQPKWRRSLLTVRPGLTGPWLLGGGERLSLEESLRLDLNYFRNYSIWLDLQMLFRTLKLLWQGGHGRGGDPAPRSTTTTSNQQPWLQLLTAAECGALQAPDSAGPSPQT